MRYVEKPVDVTHSIDPLLEKTEKMFLILLARNLPMKVTLAPSNTSSMKSVPPSVDFLHSDWCTT